MRSPLGTRPDGRRPGGQIGPGEDVAPVLVRVADDDHGVAALAQDPPQLAEDHAHPLEERRVVGGVGQVVGRLGDHRVVGPAVRVGLGERAAGHRHRQLQVVRRVGRDEVDRSRSRWSAGPRPRRRPAIRPRTGRTGAGRPDRRYRDRPAPARRRPARPTGRARHRRRPPPSAARARCRARAAARGRWPRRAASRRRPRTGRAPAPRSG